MERCTDNRFELIEKYKEKLIEATNIETAKDEMNVIDNILFRFWQMGWLDKLEADVVPKAEVAREIFNEVELAMLVRKVVRNRTEYYEFDLKESIAELRKKYIGE